MMPYQKNNEGISETAAGFLIVVLVCALAAITYGVFFGGFTQFFQTTSLVAASGAVSYVPITTSTSFPVFSILPLRGEPFYLTGQAAVPAGSPSASFLLVAPDGTNAKTTLSGYSGSTGEYGKSLYIYRDRDFAYKVSDSVSDKTGRIQDLQKGTWKITMIDDEKDVPLTEFLLSVGGSGYTVNPLASTTIWTNSTDLSLINSSGYLIPFTNNGVTSYTLPSGLKMFSFNGTGSYIRGSDNPDLDFTGDLSLSLWIKPDTTAGYHQIVGKGQSGDAGENYELFLINGKLYFEWTDAASNTVYHIMTNSAVVDTSLKYVALTIESGTPKIYYNGVSQPIGYYHSNVPGSTPVGAVPVNLLSNSNPITIGMQNYPGAEFYYDGDMSEISFYNRPLSETEIADNLANYET